MTKQEILVEFKDLNHVYNDCTKLDNLKHMLDELEPSIIYVVLSEYHHDVDGYEEVDTSILGVFSKHCDANIFCQAYNNAHKTDDEDYYFCSHIERWGVDNINAEEYFRWCGL